MMEEAFRGLRTNMLFMLGALKPDKKNRSPEAKLDIQYIKAPMTPIISIPDQPTGKHITDGNTGHRQQGTENKRGCNRLAQYLSGSREILGSDPVCYLHGKSCCGCCFSVILFPSRISDNK